MTALCLPRVREEYVTAHVRTGCPQARSAVRRTRTRRKRHRENGEYGAMVLRIVAAYGRRVAQGDPDDLAVMLACRAEFDTAIKAAIRVARADLGWTWADIGRAAGVTRSTAHERWGGTK
jgi:hypothetical protein